jgi:GT2 family glycosyltransferase
MEVIVVDDGATDGTVRVARAARGPAVTVVRQPNAGVTAARNNGAARARGRLLVFVDDDVELLPDAVEALVEAHARWPRAVVVGLIASPPPENAFQRLDVAGQPAGGEADVEIRFNECFTGVLSIGREEFFSLGRFRDPTGEWPSWDDIDFGFRARESGFRLVRCVRARGIHHDEWATSLEQMSRRWRAASRSAVRLFQLHPGLQHSFPMYRDKLPVRWGEDSLSLTLRKLLRSLVSSRLVLTPLARLAGASSRHGWAPRLTRSLCGCVVGGNQWRGLRDGLSEFGPLAERGVEQPTDGVTASPPQPGRGG